ncbi:GNAT family N-acetyltransferase [Anaerotruncus rubiinfantis]|uniref:GNAT family N-acetyltransferase n=1 Tax=Anaerotruncus rubiinfantis TaxID=1720200 RepID=UPI0034A32B8E
MDLERITNPLHPMYKRALELYQISFPLHEQREGFSQAAILNDDTYHFELIYDAGVFIGLVLYWENLNYIYIEHFCILPEMRNKQYGKRVLSLLQKQKKTLILEIDPPIDAVSIRRKGFYERCEFVENPYFHIHPPYHKGDKGHELVVMSSPRPISQAEYDAFYAHLQNKIMNHAFL